MSDGREFSHGGLQDPDPGAMSPAPSGHTGEPLRPPPAPTSAADPSGASTVGPRVPEAGPLLVSDSDAGRQDDDGGAVTTSKGPPWRWLTTVLLAMAVGGVIVLVILLVQANGDTADAEDARDVALADLESSESARLAAEGSVSDLRAELDSTTAALEAATAARREAEARSDAAGVDLAEARAELEAARDELDATEEATVRFLTLSLSEGAGIPEQDAICMAEYLLDEYGAAVVGEFVAAGLEDDDSSRAAVSLGLKMLAAADDCGVDDAALDGGLSDGFEYGDDPVLDTLQDACLDGVGDACDELWRRSAPGSEYERIGATCGDRFTIEDAPLSCEGSI